MLQYLDGGVLAIEQIKDMSRAAGSVQNEGALGERITRLRKKVRIRRKKRNH